MAFVDDTFTALHKDEIDTFHEHLNRQNPHIQFTKEIEENGKIPFLDCLVSRDENKLRTAIYRKPTHTDRLLDQSSYNPTSHKATTIQILTRRAQLVCDSTDSLADETNYLNNVFSKNNYNADFVRRNTYKPAEHNATNANPTPVTTATTPYIKGTSETIARIAVRARFGPFHLNWPEPVLLGRPERGNGKRPRSSSCKFNFKPKQETETDKSINIYLCIRGLSCKHTQLCYWRLHTHSCRYTFHHTHLKHLQKNEKLY